MPLYMAHNGPMQTTASPVSVTTGTAVKTLLQIAFPSTNDCLIKAWGISFDGSAAATPGKVELIETDVAATVTALVAADITKYSDPAGRASQITLGTAASGYTASAEGTIAAVRTFDMQLIAPTNQYVYQWPLGQEPYAQLSKFVRVRVTFGAAVNAYCWIIWEE